MLKVRRWTLAASQKLTLNAQRSTPNSSYAPLTKCIAACVVLTVLEKLGCDSLTVSDRGLRHGVLAERFSAPAGTGRAATVSARV